jgi:hypothetical protein
MKEKKFFSVMIALLLGALLFFIGCGDDGTVPNWYDGLGNVGVDADTVTVSVSQDLTAPLTVPANWTLVIDEGTTLTIKPGVTLTVKAAGTLKVPALDGNGMPTNGQVAYTGTGKVEFEQGAKGYFGTDPFISSGDDGIYKWDSTATGSKVTLKGGYVTELTAGKAIVRAATGVAANTETVIAEGETLTVADNVTFTVGGTLTVNGTFAGGGTNSALVKVGTITLGSNEAKNFYPSNGTTAESTVSSTSYKWTANAGGEAVAGWKAQS